MPMLEVREEAQNVNMVFAGNTTKNQDFLIEF